MIPLRQRLVAAIVALSVSACGETTFPDEPVTFINLRVEEISATRAVVRFDTSVPTSCELAWGYASSTLDQVATDPDMADGETAIDHEVAIEDLTAASDVYFEAVATNRAGVTYRSPMMSFRTLMGMQTAMGTNVALLSEGATIADKSSNWSGVADDQVWGANRAIDGMMATEWSSDFDGDDAWLTIDLGQTRTLSAFGFRSRKMTDGTSIITSVRLVIDGGMNLGPFSTPDPDTRYLFSLPSIDARTVRVEAVTTTGGNAGVKEIELYEL